MPMRYFKTPVMSHDRFIEYHNQHKDQLEEDRIDCIEVNVVGWGDEPQMCDAKLYIKYAERNGSTQEEQYKEWESDWDHQVKMTDKWKEYTETAANYLIHHHSQCNGADYGGRAQLFFHVQKLEVEQHIYGHKYAYSKELPQRRLR